MHRRLLVLRVWLPTAPRRGVVLGALRAAVGIEVLADVRRVLLLDRQERGVHDPHAESAADRMPLPAGGGQTEGGLLARPVLLAVRGDFDIHQLPYRRDADLLRCL